VGAHVLCIVDQEMTNLYRFVRVHSRLSMLMDLREQSTYLHVRFALVLE